MWKDVERERERLNRLCMNHMLTFKGFYERECLLDELQECAERAETTEGGRPFGDLFDINDPDSRVEYGGGDLSIRRSYPFHNLKYIPLSLQ